MLEAAEVGHVLDKAAFARAEPRLRTALLQAQYVMKDAGSGPVLVLLAGIAGGGRSETANRLTSWMDPRFAPVTAFGERTEEERLRPDAWRYWTALPPKGRVGIFMNAWYAEALDAHLDGGLDAAALDAILQRVREHEQMLADEGVQLVKVWLHMRREDLEARLRALDDDPRTSWRVTKEHWRGYRRYHRNHALFEHVLRETSTACAPWSVVEGFDERFRDMAIGRLVLAGLRAAARGRRAAHVAAPVAPEAVDNVKRLRDLDLARTLDDDAYERELETLQGRLAKLTRAKRFAKRSLVVVFEGVDAAGKGGAIRRVTGALDARSYRLVPIAAPSDEELAHPYLWRFWRHVPRRGGIVIFDRSWYGRVLVERVEGFAADVDWLRAYDEINRFEEELVRAGSVVVKFWLHISRGEQLKRFR
ncbi:MAG TPA: polyphosphate:AMP phosphotransferase, partial [Casimicrobiaceae bacterium]|nr:polyphosphate:AMP phosphotransferase [Casimicrobiaceae bacterium]